MKLQNSYTLELSRKEFQDLYHMAQAFFYNVGRISEGYESGSLDGALELAAELIAVTQAE